MTQERNEPNARRLKLRSVLGAYGTVILLVFMLLTAAGAGLTYEAHGQTTVEPVEKVESDWTQEVEYSHTATVTESNALFPVGSEFTDAETYLTRIAPEATVTVWASYDDADSAEDVSIAANSELVIRSDGESGEYWRDERHLGDVVAEDVAPGESVSHEFTVNVSEIEDRIEEIEATIGTTPGELDVRIVTTVEVEGTIEGTQENYARTVDVPIDIEADTYTFSNPDGGFDRIEQTDTVLVEREPGPLRSVGGPIAILIGAAGVAFVGIGRRNDWFDLSNREREYLAYLNDREEYEEWIKTAELPEEAHKKPVGRAESFADLARLAIDAEAPLVREPNTERYHVVTNEYRYTFHPEEVRPRDPGEDRSESALVPQIDDFLNAASDANMEATTEEKQAIVDPSDDDSESDADS